MHRRLLKLARLIYRAIPFRPLRQVGFSAYARSVRHRIVRAEVDGAEYELDLGEMIDLALYLGQFEPDVRAAIGRVTGPGMTVLDIGANIGSHTLLLARIVGPTGHVIAFEPTEFAFSKLERNVSLNPTLNAEPVRVALSAHAAAHQVVNFRSSWRTDGARKDGPSTVNFVRLDDWAEQHGLAGVDVIKMDVDGNEFGVITGGLNTIAASLPVLIMEAVGLHFDNDATNPFRVLESIGYAFRDIAGDRVVTIDAMRARLPKDDPAMSFSLNLIAQPAKLPSV